MLIHHEMTAHSAGLPSSQRQLADDEQHDEEHSVHDAEEAEEGRRVRCIRFAQARDHRARDGEVTNRDEARK